MNKNIKACKNLCFFCFIVGVLLAGNVLAQSTTIGGGIDPVITNTGHVSDYNPQGLYILSDGVSTLINNSTWEHGNSLMDNLGSWTSSTGSIDSFVFPGANTISGTNAPNFYTANFTIGATTMSITNNNGINISNLLVFNNAITNTVRDNTNVGSIHFADGASYSNSAVGDNQHVNGYVSKAGSSDFIFPVGSGTDYRPLAISAVPAGNNDYSVAWIVNDPTNTPDPSNSGALHAITSFALPITSVSPVGQWDWINVTGTDDNIAIRVSIPDMTNYATASDLRLVGWNGLQWIDLSESATATGATENEFLSGTIPIGIDISAIAIGSIATPLPIKLISFNVTCQETIAQLKWVTSAETNADRFEIQRSVDGKVWISIGQKAATGESSVLRKYDFDDPSPAVGSNYYRLKIIDIDGTFTYSRIASVSFERVAEVVIYPNPVSKMLQLKGIDTKYITEFIVFNTEGVVSLKTNSISPNGVDISNLQSGKYIVKINTINGQTMIRNLVVRN